MKLGTYETLIFKSTCEIKQAYIADHDISEYCMKLNTYETLIVQSTDKIKCD